jgi:hypothetical protein
MANNEHGWDIINPFTKKEYTEIEILKCISEDIHRLWNIENTLGKDAGPNETIAARIEGIENYTYRTDIILPSIKRLLIAVVCLLSGTFFLLLCIIFKFVLK